MLQREIDQRTLLQEAAMKVISEHHLEAEFMKTLFEIAEFRGVISDLYKPTNAEIRVADELASFCLPALPEE